MFFGVKDKSEYDGLRLVKEVNPTYSGLYADLLKENDIPFLVRQAGVDGYLKIVTGGFWGPDNYYVRPEDYDKALEIYNAFIEIEAEEN